jgi:hypothetical protein
LTAEATAGQATFVSLGCDGCHGGDDFTNSAEGTLYDVGTLTEMSGSRLGGELTGIDTPTLLGIWQTAPYLHDGSAPTLRDVLTTRNPGDAHGVTSTLSEQQLDELVAYLMQIDHGLPPVELELPTGGGTGGMGGMGGAGGEPPVAGATSSGGLGGAGGDSSSMGGMGGEPAEPPLMGGTSGTGGGGGEPVAGTSGTGGASQAGEDSTSSGCGCRIAGPSRPLGDALGWLSFGLSLALLRRRTSRRSV